MSSEAADIRSRPVDGRDEEVDARRVDWSRRLGGRKTVSVRNALGTKGGVDSLSLGGRFASSLRTTAWRADLAASRVAFIARGPCLSNLLRGRGMTRNGVCYQTQGPRTLIIANGGRFEP